MIRANGGVTIWSAIHLPYLLGGGTLQNYGLLAVLLAATSTGCIAYNEPLATKLSGDVFVPTAFKSVRVMVIRPQLGEPLPPPLEYLSGLDPNDILEFRTRDSDHIVQALADIDVFAEVAYTDSSEFTSSLREVAIKPYYLPLQPHCDGSQIFVVFLTLGLLPAGCTRDLGIYFEVIDRELPPFLCPWPQSELVGWFPAFLATGLGNWQREENRDAFLQQVRSCISQQAELFGP